MGRIRFRVKAGLRAFGVQVIPPKGGTTNGGTANGERRWHDCASRIRRGAKRATVRRGCPGFLLAASLRRNRVALRPTRITARRLTDLRART